MMITTVKKILQACVFCIVVHVKYTRCTKLYSKTKQDVERKQILQIICNRFITYRLSWWRLLLLHKAKRHIENTSSSLHSLTRKRIRKYNTILHTGFSGLKIAADYFHLRSLTRTFSYWKATFKTNKVLVNILCFEFKHSPWVLEIDFNRSHKGAPISLYIYMYILINQEIKSAC